MKKHTEPFLGTTITLDEILEKFKYHPSIKRIRETFNDKGKFSFKEITKELARKYILHLDDSKATQAGDIPVELLKLTMDVDLGTIRKITNLLMKNGCLPNDLK